MGKKIATAAREELEAFPELQGEPAVLGKGEGGLAQRGADAAELWFTEER